MDISSILSLSSQVPVLAFKVTIAIGLAKLALSIVQGLVLSLYYNIILNLFQKKEPK